MINKDRLIKEINTLIELEERLNPLLSKHISSSLSFSSLKDSERKEIVTYFKDRTTIQARHLEILNGILEELKNSKTDVY